MSGETSLLSRGQGCHSLCPRDRGDQIQFNRRSNMQIAWSDDRIKGWMCGFVPPWPCSSEYLAELSGVVSLTRAQPLPVKADAPHVETRHAAAGVSVPQKSV